MRGRLAERAHPRALGRGHHRRYGPGFWQITTASHIDWPQQARIVEFLADRAGLAIACTVIDSAAPAGYRGSGEPADLAALSRELAANDWQVRDLITADGGAGAGTAADRTSSSRSTGRGRPRSAGLTRRRRRALLGRAAR